MTQTAESEIDTTTCIECGFPDPEHDETCAKYKAIVIDSETGEVIEVDGQRAVLRDVSRSTLPIPPPTVDGAVAQWVQATETLRVAEDALAQSKQIVKQAEAAVGGALRIVREAYHRRHDQELPLTEPEPEDDAVAPAEESDDD